ncbi:hypothetical protein FA702_09315 [Novosphingobium sp. EMRT-2]|nr:hypothetical protein FA702_09315 [Novosphingobium sp. EMRT-2]
MRLKSACLSIALAILPAATAWAADAAPAAKPSLQEEFNKASEAAENGQCGTALEIFNRLAVDPRVKPGTLSYAAIAVRRGNCLVSDGEFEEGSEQIHKGLPILVAAGPDFTFDVMRAEDSLGRAAAQAFDHDAAIIHYRKALALVQGAPRAQILVHLAQVTAFDGGTVPLDYANEALGVVQSIPKASKESLAIAYTTRGRIYLNQGQIKEATADFRKAVDLAGGLTLSKVSINDVAIRSDLAQAQLLAGKRDEARLTLAYTGAGRIEKSRFTPGRAMPVPECGQEFGLRPEDSAIVEFSIDDDGHVLSAQTIYSRGNYRTAATFARAALDWSWQPEQIAKVPAFFRALTRVEMRCSNSGAGMPGIVAPLFHRMDEWASPIIQSSGFPNLENSRLYRSREQLHQFGASRETAGDARGAAAAFALAALADGRAIQSRVDEIDHAMALLEGAKGNPQALNSLRVMREVIALAMSASKTKDPRSSAANRFLSLADMPDIAGDALAQATVRLLAAERLSSKAGAEQKVELYQRVADDARLGEGHPLRQVALLYLANIAAAQGHLQDAQGFFQRTGLTEQQCSVIGAAPALRSSRADSSDYPLEALHMGFEGWVKLEFDISADGKTANTRALLAYPPFVFVDAASGMARDFRYATSYRPSGGSACAAQSEVVNFVNP